TETCNTYNAGELYRLSAKRTTAYGYPCSRLPNSQYATSAPNIVRQINLLQNLSYIYDAVGNLSAIKETGWSGLGRSVTYTYGDVYVRRSSSALDGVDDRCFLDSVSSHRKLRQSRKHLAPDGQHVAWVNEQPFSGFGARFEPIRLHKQQSRANRRNNYHRGLVQAGIDALQQHDEHSPPYGQYLGHRTGPAL